MSRNLCLLMLVVLLLGYLMIPGRASSHREAPLISGDPQADNTDLYAFVSPDKPDTVTIIGSWIPFEDPAGGPDFYRFGDSVLYQFHIDNVGDAQDHVTFQFRFTTHVNNPNTFLYNTGPILSINDPNRNVYQTYTMTMLVNGNPTLVAGPMYTMPDNVGFASTPNYGGNGSGIYGFSLPGGTGTGAVFAGQTDDAFFLDLRVFDLLYGGNLSEAGTDSLAGFNVHSIALQVPRSALRGGTPIIGVWATASRPAVSTRTAGSQTDTGSFVQVSRLGMPLVNELVIPVGQKDVWNGSQPSGDAQFLPFVTNPEVPNLLQAIYGIPAPAAPRNDLVQVFLTGVPGLNQPPGVKPAEMLRLNTDVLPTANPARLGVLAADIQGFPNGRRLTDDVVDITEQVAVGALLGVKTTLGDGVDRNDLPFRTTFPYIALPSSGGQPWKLNPNPPQGQSR